MNSEGIGSLSGSAELDSVGTMDLTLSRLYILEY